MAKKILLIDDEELVVKSLSRLLSRQGYDVIICHNGEDAIKKAENENIDLIVCDVRMPVISGIETIKRIREAYKVQKKKPVKEILITGYADEALSKEAEDLRVSEYIYKPFDLRDFIACIERAVGKA